MSTTASGQCVRQWCVGPVRACRRNAASEGRHGHSDASALHDGRGLLRARSQRSDEISGCFGSCRRPDEMVLSWHVPSPGTAPKNLTREQIRELALTRYATEFRWVNREVDQPYVECIPTRARSRTRYIASGASAGSFLTEVCGVRGSLLIEGTASARRGSSGLQCRLTVELALGRHILLRIPERSWVGRLDAPH